MQNQNPELVREILDLRKEEINIQKQIVDLEQKEQDARLSELPYIRKYTFRGQAMAFVLGVGSLIGAAYFGYSENTALAIAFLTSTVIVGAVQFLNIKNKN